MQFFRRYKPFEECQLLRGNERNGVEARKDLLGDEGVKEISRLMVRHDDRRAQPPRQPKQGGKKARRVLAIQKVNHVDV
jgi:hypothetical protein